MIEGFIDYIDDGRAVGWAYDSARPGLRLLIEITVSDVTRTVLADVERNDLREAGKGDGRHGFVAKLDAGAIGAEILEARVVPEGQALHGSPYRIDLLAQIGRRPGLQYLRSEARQACIALGMASTARPLSETAEVAPTATAAERAPRLKLRDRIRSNVIGQGRP